MFYEGIIGAVNKMASDVGENEEDPIRRNKRGLDKRLNSQYGKYSGLVDIEGKTIKKPTELDAIRTMVQYLKNNWLGQSNVYRPEHIHTSLNYKKGRETVG